jgi:hypothetical protein
LTKKEKLLGKLNTNTDDKDIQDTIAIADTILENQLDVDTSNRRAEASKMTKTTIANLRMKLKRCSKYISLVEGMASHEVAFPHRLVAESTFFEVVSLSFVHLFLIDIFFFLYAVSFDLSMYLKTLHCGLPGVIVKCIHCVCIHSLNVVRTILIF